MSRNIDGMLNELLEVNFKTYSGYSKAYEKFSKERFHLDLSLDRVIKILNLKNAPRSAISEHHSLLPSYYFRMSWGFKKEDYFKTFSTLDKYEFLCLVDFEDQYEETKIILDEYKALKNLGDLI